MDRIEGIALEDDCEYIKYCARTRDKETRDKELQEKVAQVNKSWHQALKEIDRATKVAKKTHGELTDAWQQATKINDALFLLRNKAHRLERESTKKELETTQIEEDRQLEKCSQAHIAHNIASKALDKATSNLQQAFIDREKLIRVYPHLF